MTLAFFFLLFVYFLMCVEVLKYWSPFSFVKFCRIWSLFIAWIRDLKKVLLSFIYTFKSEPPSPFFFLLAVNVSTVKSIYKKAAGSQYMLCCHSVWFDLLLYGSLHERITEQKFLFCYCKELTKKKGGELKTEKANQVFFCVLIHFFFFLGWGGSCRFAVHVKQ